MQDLLANSHSRPERWKENTLLISRKKKLIQLLQSHLFVTGYCSWINSFFQNELSVSDIAFQLPNCWPMFRLPHCFSQGLYRASFIHTRVFVLSRETNFLLVTLLILFFFKPFFFQMPCISLQRAMVSIRNHLLSCCNLRVSLLSPDEVSIVRSFEHLDFGFLSGGSHGVLQEPLMVQPCPPGSIPWRFTGSRRGRV